MRDDLVAKAFVSCNSWVAQCPNPHGCIGAEHGGRAARTEEEHAGLAPRTGPLGGLTRDGFRCSRCGLICRAQWPDNAEDIWFVLQQRPDWIFRSWTLGETLEDLMIENAAHGILPPGIEAGGVAIVGGRFTDRQLVAGVRRAVGA